MIDGAGATLMPGMVEAHTHFSWNDAANLSDLQRLPLEEHVLWSASVAKRYLEAGWTSCVGAACAKPRLDVVTRNAINQGLIPGPRYLAASQEITVLGGARRRDAAAPAVPGAELRRGGDRGRGDAARGADVPQVRRRLDQAQPLGRQLHAVGAPAEHHLDERRGGRGRGEGGRGCAASAWPRTRAPASRSSSACATASRSSTTRASPTRRPSTCWRPTATSTSWRPASAS